MRHLYLTLFLCFTLALTACGSGGGGGDDYDLLKGADIDLSVKPNAIGVGERTLVTVDIRRVNPDGVVVVVRYTTGSLRLVTGSTRLIIGRDSVAITPTFGPGARSEFTYVTFYLPQSTFDEDLEGRIELELFGDKRDNSARVEIDQFKHDVLISPEREFSLSDPNFSADDEEAVDVLN